MRKLIFGTLFFCGFILACKSQTSNPVNGVYKTNSNQFISIAPFGTGKALFYSDGRVFSLKDEGNNLLIGKTLGNNEEIIGKIVFQNEGKKIMGFIKYNDGNEIKIEKIKLVEKKVEFKNENQKLAGELILPEGRGPFAVVAQTHGSGEETREASRGLAYLFASNGIASFIFDKRGCGESSGKEWRASFKDYANDLLAAVDIVSTFPEINSKKIGLFGHSQGGWIVPLAYSLKPDRISFCIISAANAQSPVEENLYAGDEEIRLRGYDEETIKEIHEFRKIKYEVGVLGKGINEYKTNILPIAEKKSWFKLTGGGLPDNIFWKENGYYDPAQALQSLKCPMLVVYAEHDISTDTKTQLPLMQKLIPSNKVMFKVFDNANHMMMKVQGRGFISKQIPLITQMADGYIEALIGWTIKTIE